MQYIAFTESVAGFAWCRLNNMLIAAESDVRVELVNARGLKFIGKRTPREEPVVEQVMAMYDCHYTEELPPGFEAYDPQPPTPKKTRKKDFPVGVPTHYFREARS